MSIKRSILSQRARHSSPRFVLFLAVLPAYRKECIQLVSDQLGSTVAFLVSRAHLDSTVKTGIPETLYHPVRMIRLLRNRIFIQLPTNLDAIRAEAVVVDLNPRSISAWGVLIVRRLIRRRTLVWGHIHSQSGAASRTAALRLAMRRLAHGTITYTYADCSRAREELPGERVWVAPNSLYRFNAMHPVESPAPHARREIVYVGRFVSVKKVELLVEGFALAAEANPDIRLRLVGGGPNEERLRALVASMNLEDKVVFGGWEDDVDALRRVYASAICSVSPGFAGLGLTQSLGFGVPMIIAADENHSPEIELASYGGVHWFESDSPASLAEALDLRWRDRENLPLLDIAESTRLRYSAEAMADGIVGALQGKRDYNIESTGGASS